jgi:hypothetical protein
VRQHGIGNEKVALNEAGTWQFQIAQSTFHYWRISAGNCHTSGAIHFRSKMIAGGRTWMQAWRKGIRHAVCFQFQSK